MYTKPTNLERAAALLGEPANDSQIVVLKLQPAFGCCCFHCWPDTWSEINRYIAPEGPIEDEGDTLLKANGERLVLQCHESGPEIILYLGAATAGLTLAKSLIDLITAFVQARNREASSNGARLRLVSTRIVEGDVVEETSVELDVPLSAETTGMIEKHVEKALRQHT